MADRVRVPRQILAGLALGALGFSLEGVAMPRPSSAQTVITCTLQVNNPHSSTHVLGNANVVATWTCTAPVSSLSMTVKLFRDNLQVAQDTCTNGGSAFLSCPAATLCVPGVYFGTATGTVVAPPGFIPPTASGTARSNTVTLTCT